MKALTRGHWKAGIDAVRSAKLRSFWTMLGVIIGVASVIIIVGIGEGVKQQIGGQINHAGDDLITVRPAQLKTGSGSGANNISVLSGFSVSGQLTDKDVDTVLSLPGLSASAPLTIASGSPKGDTGTYKGGFVIGTTSDLSSLLNQSMAHGIFLASDDTESNVAVLGHRAAEEMFDVDVPLGHSFTYRGREFIVQGIFNQFSIAPLSQPVDFNDAVFIPHAVAEKLTNNTAPTYEILARAETKDKTDGIVQKIQKELDRSHGGDSGFSVTSGRQNQATSNEVLDLMTRLIAGIAAISLLVGGVGIMNVMLVSVAERMHEIGIRKAVGATNRQILNQFLIESTVLGVIGGIIGIIVAVLVNLGLRVTTDLKPVLNWEIVAIATLVSLLVGIIFGTVPAIKAARKDPIDALRAD